MKALDFLNKVNEAKIVFHSDADGVCSAVLVAKYLKGRGAKVKFVANDLDERKLNLLDINKNLIFVDLAVDQYEDFVKKLKKALIIDHHKISFNLNEIGLIHVNPRFKSDKYVSCSQVIYDIVGGPEWIMKIGAVGDMALKGTEQEEEGGRIISAIKVVKGLRALPKVVDELLICENISEFVEKPENQALMDILDKEIETQILKFDIQGAEDINFFNIRSKLSILGIVSTALFDQYPNKTIICYKKKGDIYKISGRSLKYDLGSIFKKATEGLGRGGGHPQAAGASVSDFKKFKKRVLELMK